MAGRSKVPVTKIRTLAEAVVRTHDAYWNQKFDRTEIDEARRRRNAWTAAVEAYEAQLTRHAPALLDAYEVLRVSRAQALADAKRIERELPASPVREI